MAQADNPNTLIPSRRAVLAGIAAAPALAAPALAASSLLLHPDAALIDIVEQLMVLDRDCKQAGEIENERYAEFKERGPKRPKELRWSPGDPVSYHRYRPAGETSAWCDPNEIEEGLRGKRMTRWEFIGSDEEREKLDACYDVVPTSNGPLPPEVAHLYIEVPHEDLQRRADEILAAHDRHQAELAKVEAETGFGEAEARANELFERFGDLELEALALRATTIEGLRAKARLAALRPSESDWTRSIVDDLLAMALTRTL